MKYLAYENKSLAEIYIANTFFSRLLGYMFQKKPRYQAILFKPCNSIHTFFMNFNIDVLFLNDKLEVVKKVENLSKGKVIMPVKDARIVIEAYSGVFENVNEGNKIELI